MIKHIILSLLLAASTLPVGAQSPDFIGYAASTKGIASPLLMKSPSTIQYEIGKPPGLRMRNAGRTLTIIGGAMFIGGVILVNNADDVYYSSQTTSHGTYEEGDAKGALGLLMVVGGAGMAVPGIILWTKGAKKYNRYLEKQEGSNASLEFKGRGLSLSYRF